LFEIGVLFDVDVLEEIGKGDYGTIAYNIFFKNLESEKMKASIIRAGDVNLIGYPGYIFCIGVQSFISSTIDYVRDAFRHCTYDGIMPKEYRFIEDVSAEPLVIAALVNHKGELTDATYINPGSLEGTGWKIV